MSKHDSDAPALDEGSRDLAANSVRDHLMTALGCPPAFYKVQVVRLWENAYRANVFVGSAADPRIAHSFFVETTAVGEIVASVPTLTRLYT